MYSNQMITVPRGAVYWLNNNMNPYMKGSIQGKSRPVVIISNNSRGSSPVVEVCTITHSERTDKCSRINVKFINDKGESNWIQCNQHFTVNISDLGKFIGMLSPEIIQKLDEGLLVAQGFSHLIDCDKEIQDLRDKINQLETERLSYDYVEVLRYELTELCRDFNYLVSEGNRKINDALKSRAATPSRPSKKATNKQTSNKADKPAQNTRKYIRWNEDTMLEFLCDYEGDISEDDMMLKWGISKPSDIKKKVSYIKKKLGM